MRLKGKFLKNVMRSTICVVRFRVFGGGQENSAEMIMLRWISGVTREDRIVNEREA